MTINNKAYITTTSIITCGGKNEDELFNNICNQQTGIAVDSTYFNNERVSIGKIDSNEYFFDLLIQEVQTILNKSNLNNFEDTLLVIGSSVGGINITESIFIKEGNYTNINPDLHNINTIQHLLEKEFTFKDGISFSTACTSSANGLGYAYEVIKKGIYKNVLVLGVDALSKTTVGGFLSLGVLSQNPCKPFDSEREGMNVSEGIACLLLQDTPSENSVEVSGVGYSSDAYHMTHPHPDGKGAKQAMENALNEASITPSEISYINAHGTGTNANDSAEANAIESLFGNSAYVSSTKSITGHTLGAAGAVEAVISKMILNQQIIPASTFLNNPENKNINLSLETKSSEIEYVMSNSFAFGGNNCSLIFRKIS